MSNDHLEHAQGATPPKPRLRFRLALFLIVVVVALGTWFVLRFVRQRGADDMLARHDAVLNAIIDNTLRPPANMTFKNPPPDRAELERNLGRTWPDDPTRREAVLEFGSPHRAVSTRVVLDIGESLVENEPESVEEVAARLADHYAAGLKEAGLKRVVSGGGAKHISVWKSAANDLDVVLSIDVDAGDEAAEVSIVFLDNQRLTL